MRRRDFIFLIGGAVLPVRLGRRNPVGNFNAPAKLIIATHTSLDKLLKQMPVCYSHVWAD
jgi:hypothetical protein